MRKRGGLGIKWVGDGGRQREQKGWKNENRLAREGEKMKRWQRITGETIIFDCRWLQCTLFLERSHNNIIPSPRLAPITFDFNC